MVLTISQHNEKEKEKENNERKSKVTSANNSFLQVFRKMIRMNLISNPPLKTKQWMQYKCHILSLQVKAEISRVLMPTCVNSMPPHGYFCLLAFLFFNY
jgi:hypothetical protein